MITTADPTKDIPVTDTKAILDKNNLTPALGGLIKTDIAQSTPTGAPTQTIIPDIGTLTVTPKVPLGSGTPVPPANPLGENTSGLYERTGTKPPPSYSVISGDTLSGIASKSGMSLQQILALNPDIKDANKINVGQNINLGGGIQKAPVGTNAVAGDENITLPSGAIVNKITGALVKAPPDLPQYPGSTTTTSQTAVKDAYDALTKSLSDIEAKINANSTPSAEEKQLSQDLADKKAELAKFDTNVESRVNSFFGQGRGATINNINLQGTIERRTSALERLGLTQEAQTITDHLALAKDARTALSDSAKTQYDLAGKRFDIALNLQKEMDSLNEKQKTDARQYLLDVVTFAGSKTYEQLDQATQTAIEKAVANSPITLDMVKTALKSASEKSAQAKAGTLRSVPGLGVVQMNPDGSGYTVVVPESPSTKQSNSGKLVYTDGDIAEGASKLEQSRGADHYVDPTIYKGMYDKWVAGGGLAQDFIKNFPPKLYVNPANTDLPSFLIPAGASSGA